MREVRIRDTLSGGVQALDPDHQVGIYACGPTVYSRIHIGNARPFVVFSLFARFLRSEGYGTRLVINVTDVNDKIYAAAARAGEGSAAFAAAMTAAYVEDTDRLGLGRPDAEPKATETIDGIVALIAKLIDGGHAYESGGDVYFRVRSFPGYGKLSNRRPEDMDQGEEAGSSRLKEERLDFALWKANKEGEDTSWDSPWGPGRPAWHIECSVMAEQELGASFAVHGGGSDLVFPHHENEIAQSESAGHPFAHVWMHNGMVDVGAEKMSKSEGNIFQLSEALDRYGREAVVAYLISGHYRQPLAFGDLQMEEAVARVERLRNFFRRQASAASGEASAEQQRGGSGESPRNRLHRSRRGSRRFARLLPTTSTRRGRWPRSSSLLPKPTGGRSPGRPRPWGRCSTSSGSVRLPPVRTRSTRWRSGCCRSDRKLGRPRTSGGPTRSATSSPRSAGRSGTRPRALD